MCLVTLKGMFLRRVKLYESVMALSGIKWSKDDQIFYDKWIQQSRKNDLLAARSHLDQGNSCG